MFNFPYISLFEKVNGGSLIPAIAETLGISERTIRNWQHVSRPDLIQQNKLENELKNGLIQKLIKKYGFSREEAEEFHENIPSTKSGGIYSGMIASDMVYFSVNGYVEGFKNSLEIANKIDNFSNQYNLISESKDIDAIKKLYIEIYDWIEPFFEDDNCETLQQLNHRLKDINTWQDCLNFYSSSSEFMIYYLFTSLDLEFCSAYFAKLQAYPLFSLVMPGIAPDIEIEERSGKFIRGEKQAKLRIFHRSTLRLLNFIYILVYWYNERKAPNKLPKVIEIAKLFGLESSTVISWRDESTKFSLRDLEQIWKLKKRQSDKDDLVGPPILMLYASHFFSQLMQIDENGKLKSIIVCESNYKEFWELNKKRLMAKGLTFGTDPWPACLLYSISANLDDYATNA